MLAYLNVYMIMHVCDFSKMVQTPHKCVNPQGEGNSCSKSWKMQKSTFIKSIKSVNITFYLITVLEEVAMLLCISTSGKTKRKRKVKEDKNVVAR